MKKHLFVFLLFYFLICSVLNAQIQIQWQRCFGGTSWDKANGVLPTYDGGYVIVGNTCSSDGDINSNMGDFDAFIVKLDAFGYIQWKRLAGGTGTDELFRVIQCPDSNYMVLGRTNTNLGGPFPGHGRNDFWLSKVSKTNGATMWNHLYGGTEDDDAFDFCPTADGGYIMVGRTWSNNGDVTGYHAGTDIWVVKAGITGNLEWQKCLGGSANDVGYCVMQDNDGNYIIGGSTLSDDGDVNGRKGMMDAWVIKLNNNGNMIWQKCLGGSDNDIAYSVIASPSGGYTLACQASSSDGDVAGWLGSSDFWLIELDTAGNIVRQKCLGGTSIDVPACITKSQCGGYAVCGKTFSNNIDVSGNHGGQYDYWVIKTDTAFNLHWQMCLGGYNEDAGRFVHPTADGGFIVAGYTNSNNFDVSGSHGAQDGWIVKLIEPNISGTVFNDMNENGIKDYGEQWMPDQIIKITPGPFYSFTNSDGRFYFRADSGNHVVSYVHPLYWYTTTPSFYNVSVNNLNHYIDTLQFGVKCRINVQDVAVYISGTAARPGFQTKYWVYYRNLGTVPASGNITFTYDSLLTYSGASMNPVSHNSNTLTFQYDTLGPNAQRMMELIFVVPGVEHLGETIESSVWISPLAGDTNITNNYDTTYTVITGSYDPNDKLSYPGVGQQGYVLFDQRLKYTIRFQNTGTDTAFNVVISDIIDSNFDLETFTVESYSHPVTWQIYPNREIRFRFANILLPDSNVNEPGSHGFVRFSISPNPMLTEGTEVYNTARIYFDFNPAIITNTTVNTYVSKIPLFINPVSYEDNLLMLFPNPAINKINIIFPENVSQIEIFDLQGKKIKAFLVNSDMIEIEIQELPKGMYYLKAYGNSGILSTKFIRN